MKARAAVAFAVGLIAFLCLGIWLGGHPAKLPGFLRDRFASAPASLTAEAAEVIEDNYYRPVGSTELSNSSLQGMVRELRQRHDDRFTEYFSPESLESFNQQIEGHFSGVGLSVVAVKAGLRAVQVFHGSPADKAGIEAGDTIVAVDGDSIAGEGSTEATSKIKGPEGTEVTLGVRDAKSGKVRQLRLVRAEVALPNVSSKVEKADGRKLGYVRMLSFSEGVARAARRRRPQGSARRGGGDRARPARQPRRAARRGGAERQHLPARGRSRRLDRLADPGPQRPQDRRRRPAQASARRPDRPRHRLRGGDPHRRPRRRRRRPGGRHPLLRQGRLPGGEGARQRRRSEDDRRRVLHPGGRQPGPQPWHPPRRQGQRRPGNAGRTRGKRGRSAFSPARSKVEPAPPGAAGPRRAGPRSRQRRSAQAREAAERPRGRRGAAARAARLPRLPAGARGRGRGAASAARRDAGARRDLTALSTFTVDPATARDFDDAVSAQREGDGARVWIHIADVAAHVRPGSPLDLEARRRANSTYVPGAVEPMLPHALSSEACSLAPGVERLAVTAEIELGPGAEPRSASFYRSRIRSDARLDYDQLDAIFAGRASAAGGGRRTARGRARGRRRPRRAARRHQPRRRIGRARVPLRRRRQRHRRPPRPPDRGPPPDRAADDPHQRAGGGVARAPAGAGDLPRPRPARPGPGRAPGRAAGGARGTDAAAGAGALGPGGGPGRRRGEPAGRPRGRAARARPRGVYIARAPLPQAGRLQRAQQRPRRPRQLRLHALHLADPPLPRPDRAPGAAGGAGGGGGGAAPGRGPRRRRRLLRPRARVDARSSAAPTTSAPPTCSNASSASAASTPSSRARSPG